jgi:hypothetical protein
MSNWKLFGICGLMEGTSAEFVGRACGAPREPFKIGSAPAKSQTKHYSVTLLGTKVILNVID